MDKNSFIEKATRYLINSRVNYIKQEQAIKQEYIGQRIFDEPVFAFGSAEDNLFKDMYKSNAIGEHFLKPSEWISNAKTVISIFLPFSEDVIKSNEKDATYPSELWLHGRIEGQMCINDFSKYLTDLLRQEGFLRVSPSIDEKIRTVEKPGSNPKFIHKEKGFTSNWSERHIAYICGLGTFGLSKGIITEKGMAGRLTSIITELEFPITIRKYNGLYEYCIMCGACVRRCPVNAISKEYGKNHLTCFHMLNNTKKKSAPRYGCGKCQTKVPCARCNPFKYVKI